MYCVVGNMYVYCVCYNGKCVVYSGCMDCVVYIVYCGVCGMQCTLCIGIVYFILCIAGCVLSIVYGVVYSVYCVLYIG